MEASAHFLQNPKNSSSTQRELVTAFKVEQRGKTGPQHTQTSSSDWNESKINNRISGGFHLSFFMVVS